MNRFKIARADVKPVRQRTQFSCMAASMAMALKSLGIECSEDMTAKVMGVQPMRGATWEDATAAAQHWGCIATLRTPATISWLKEKTDQGDPVIIAWNPEGREWSHASVVFDVDDQENVHIADPNIPDPEQTVRIVSRKDFYGKWSEKWPRYMVRRPAMWITREITPEGRQIMASTNSAQRNFHYLGQLRMHLHPYKLLAELVCCMDPGICGSTLQRICDMHQLPCRHMVTLNCLRKAEAMLHHMDADTILDELARMSPTGPFCDGVQKLTQKFCIKIDNGRSMKPYLMSTEEMQQALNSHARRLASTQRVAGSTGRKVPVDELLSRFEDDDDDDYGAYQTRTARFRKGEKVPMEEMVKRFGPKWKEMNEKHRGRFKGKGKGKGKKDKKKGKKRSLARKASHDEWLRIARDLAPF